MKNLRQLFVLMLKSPRQSINPEPAIQSFNETGKLSGVKFSQEVIFQRREGSKRLTFV